MNNPNQTNTLQLKPERALWLLSIIAVVVILLSLLGVHMRFFPHAYEVHTNNQANFIEDFSIETNLNLQHNIPTYFDMLFLSLGAYLLFLISKFKNKAKDKFRVLWSVMAWSVFLLAMDNFTEILYSINYYFQTDEKSTPFPTTMMVLAGVILLTFILLWTQFPVSSRWLLIGFGLTFFGASIAKVYTLVYSAKDLYLTLYAVLEETMKYAGEIMLIHALLLYWQMAFPKIKVSIINSGRATKTPR